MSAFDTFRRILFNAGEQGIAADYNDLQSHALLLVKEMFFNPMFRDCFQDRTGGIQSQLDPEISRYIQTGDESPIEVALTAFPSCASIVPGTGARTLKFGSAGPIMMFDQAGPGFSNRDSLVAGTDQLLMYWVSQNEITLTTDIGDADRRIDIVEMKLEMVDGSPENRVGSTAAVKSSLDLGTLTTHIDTVIQASFGGVDGDNLRFTSVADGGGSHFFTQAGAILTYHFTDGVTTVSNFEADVTATGVLQVKVPGTGANILADPADVVTEEPLIGGINQILASTSFNKARHVQATFQIKKGTPSAGNPDFPTPTSGFVPIAAVVIPPSHNAVHSIAGMKDMRWPIGGIRTYDVWAKQMLATGGSWSLNSDEFFMSSSGTTNQLVIPCPAGGGMGRIMAVGMEATLIGPTQFKLAQWSVGNLLFQSDLLGSPLNDVLTTPGYFGAWATALDLMADAGSVYGVRITDTRIGNPFWTSGNPYGPIQNYNYDGSGFNAIPALSRAALVLKDGTGSAVYAARWVIAHGLG